MRIRRPSKSLDYNRRTALYRLFDAEGRLLYVGIAFDPQERWSGHAREKAWWPAVAERTVEWHDSRIAAASAEITAIRTEKPVHNVRDTQEEQAKRAAHAAGVRIGRMIRIDDEMWDLYDRACAEEGTTRTDDLRRHVHSRVRAYCKAQGIEMPKPKPRIVRRKKPAADSD